MAYLLWKDERRHNSSRSRYRRAYRIRPRKGTQFHTFGQGVVAVTSSAIAPASERIKLSHSIQKLLCYKLCKKFQQILVEVLDIDKSLWNQNLSFHFQRDYQNPWLPDLASTRIHICRVKYLVSGSKGSAK